MDRKPTIYDIAREAGVSTATVTRVMAGSAKVKAETREKVQAVIQRLGFVPNAAARNLERGRSGVIGVVLPRIDSPYYVRMLQAADDEARSVGCTTMNFQAGDRMELDDALADRILSCRLDGLMIAGSLWTDRNEAIARTISRLNGYMPVVAICPPSTELDCICLYNDLLGCARTAARYLYNLGHRRIAYIGGTVRPGEPSERGRACLDELRRLGLPDYPGYHVDCGHDAESGERGTLRLLSGMPREEWPTAIIAFSDHVALGILKQLKRMKVRVPEEMAVIGCDNQYFCAYTDPPLTSVELHPEDVARSAVREILSDHPQRVAYTMVVDAVMVVRESCMEHAPD